MATDATLLTAEAARLASGKGGPGPGLFPLGEPFPDMIEPAAIAGIRGPEYIIAASDSSPRHRRMAHAICDGTDDQAQFQEAVDLFGGDVVAMPGSYTWATAGTVTSGEEYCLLIDRADVRLRLMPGATLVPAAGTTGYMIHVAQPYVGGPLPTLLRNIRVEGPGTINCNTENIGGVRVAGFVGDVFVGGGLRIMGCRGDASEAEPLVFFGDTPGGQTLGDFFTRRCIMGHVYVSDCDEGVWIIYCKDTVVDRLFIDGINDQDAFEALAFDNLMVSNSVFKASAGSAVDIFGSSTTTMVHNRALFSNCVFGPITSASVLFSLAAQGDGQAAQTFKDVHVVGCHFDMDVCAVGLAIATNTGQSHSLGALVEACVFDGTAAAAGAEGISVGPDADQTMVIGNKISNCPGNAIELSASLANIQVRTNGGWGNGGGLIRATPPATSYATNNNFDA